MYSKIAVVAALMAFAEARFGQEGLVQSKISALGSFGNPGQAATLAGASPGVLLGGANACAKLQLADQIVSELGNDPQVIAAAAALVAAEKNFNPFTSAIPTICSDPSLPATAELRGIVPLVDPAVGGSDVENANSASSVKTPFSAQGLSQADVAKANGFSNFTAQAADGTAAAPAGGNAGGNAGNNGNNNKNNNNNGNKGNNNGNAKAGNGGAANCGAVRTLTTVVAAAPTATPASGNAGNNKGNNGNNAGNAGNNAGSNAAVNFGSCDPTIKFQGGLGGRPATEFTFQSNDAKIAANQQEALNPNIITNRVCDELTNICNANQAAKTLCQSAKAQIQALGTRDASTAAAWNKALGF